MTNEQLRQNAAAMVAVAEGKTIQWRSVMIHATTWSDLNRPEGAIWNFYEYEYRIKPHPVSRPWSKPEDVPGPVCWVRYEKQNPQDYSCAMIVGMNQSGFWTFEEDASDTFLKWTELEAYEHSTDQKTWHPCTVEEQP